MSHKHNNTKSTWLAKADKWYIKNPVVRALIQLLGGVTFGTVSTLDAALATQIQNMQDKKFRAFFEELDRGDTQLSNANIQSNDFLHAFFATIKAALNTRRHEKIQMFARLLKSLANNKALEAIDEYEDYLNVLDELICREIIVLSTLEKYEGRQPSLNQLIASMNAHSFWKHFVQEAAANISASEDDVQSILVRLTRTGCYKIFDTTYRDALENCGRLTPFYYKLKKLISESPDTHGRNN